MAAAAAVAQPRRAIGEQASRVHIRGHVRERRLRELKVRERLAEHRARSRVRERFIQRALREAERGAGDGGAEHVQRLHGELEAFAFGAEPLRYRHAAALEGERGQRMRRDDVDAPGDREARRVRVDDERADASARPCRHPARFSAGLVRANTQ